MPDIRPSSDLRNKFPEIERYVRDTGNPVFITSRGRASMVLLSHEKYEELTGEAAPVKGSNITDEQKEQFGKVIANLRVCADMSVSELAEKAEIPVWRIEEVEAGASIPNDDELDKLAETLKVNVSTLEFFARPDDGGKGRVFKNLLMKILNSIAGE